MSQQLSKVMNSDQSTHSANSGVNSKANSLLYETVCAFNGHYVTRLKSSLFYWGVLLSLITGIVLLYYKFIVGGFLVLTLAPCLLLYPLIRFLFGGKDSVGAVITTAVIEEILKGEIFKAIEKSSNKKRR